MNQTPKYGDWIFTCSLKPLQFHSFKDNELDDFITIEGSNHSRKHCGLNVVSEKYAKFFLENNLDQYYDKFNIDFKTLSHLEKVNHGLFKRKKDDVIIYYIGKDNRVKSTHSSYKSRFHKRYLDYKDFRMSLPTKYDTFKVYEEYIKFKCKQNNLTYEGY